MRNCYILREETIQPEFDVRITPNLDRYLYIIRVCNRFNKDGIMRLDESLERIQKDLSYRKNGLECVNGMPMRAYGLNVYYKLLNDINSGEPYVIIYRMDVDFNYFGLVDPTTFRKPTTENKNRITIKESQLRKMVREAIRRVSRIILRSWDSFKIILLPFLFSYIRILRIFMFDTSTIALCAVIISF